MSKRNRRDDNSKRQQPVQQQRAQARQPGSGGPAKAGNTDARSREDDPGSPGKK